MLVLVPWKNGRQDRLYVNGPGGNSLGWLDQVSGEVHVEAGEHAEAVTAALRPAAGTPRVRLWARGAVRRLYVTDGWGSGVEHDVGWGDVLTGQVNVQPGRDRELLDAALACHREWRAWAGTTATADQSQRARDSTARGKARGLLRRLTGR